MNKQIKQYVGYFRVSTNGQGESGAGLAGQRQAVLGYINGRAELIKEFKEVESGTKNRPELKKAIDYCKETGACLVASKIDRLARSLWLFESIKRAGIDFEIVGLPKNPLVQQVLASVAEWEARAISERTKSALAVKKAQGVKMGYDCPEVREGIARYWAKRKAEIASRPVPVKIKQPTKREKADKMIIPHLKLLRKQGQTWQAIAKELNQAGLISRSGKPWHYKQLWRVAKRNNVA